ncbi:MAG: hypothetical protein NC311_17465, partial [Muribaculaceae bacterium]|nr:hypothetical protein [Muribaculaceae bacterium]
FQYVMAGEFATNGEYKPPEGAPEMSETDPIITIVYADTGTGLGNDADNGAQKGLSSAIVEDGSVYVWGNNEYGQIGNRIIGQGPLDLSVNKLLPTYVDGYRLAIENEPEGVENNRLVVVFQPDDTTGVMTARWRIHPVIYYFNVYNEIPYERNRDAHYIFTSTDESVAKVTEDGRLIYTGVGQATIMVQEGNLGEEGLKTFLEVEVLPADVNYFKDVMEVEKDPETGKDVSVTKRVLRDDINLVVPALATGLDFSVAMTAMGSVYSFGGNTYGQLGISNLSTTMQNWFAPVQTGGGNMVNMVSLAAGNNFALAVGSNGYVYAWGQNTLGSLGQATDISSNAKYHTPQRVKGPGGVGYLGDDSTGKVIKVFAHGNSSAAITERGEVYVWGDSGNYQLGARLNTSAYAYPHKVPGIDHAMEIYLSTYNMLVVLEDTSVWTAGAKATRILGWSDLDLADQPRVYDADGTAAYTMYPMPMLSPLHTETATNEDGEVLTNEKGEPLVKATEYLESVVYAGLGDTQAILMTQEYIQPTEEQLAANENLTLADGEFNKHLYMMGQDSKGLLGTLFWPEEQKEIDNLEGVGESLVYVNLPMEYTFFQEEEYKRLIALADSAKETVDKYGARFEQKWEEANKIFSEVYEKHYEALQNQYLQNMVRYEQQMLKYQEDLKKYIDGETSTYPTKPTEPTRATYENVITSIMQSVDNTMEFSQSYGYIASHPDWVKTAVEDGAQNLIDAYEAHAKTKAELVDTEKSLEETTAKLDLWNSLLKKVKGSSEYNKYLPLENNLTAAQTKLTTKTSQYNSAAAELSTKEAELKKAENAKAAAQEHYNDLNNTLTSMKQENENKPGTWDEETLAGVEASVQLASAEAQKAESERADAELARNKAKDVRDDAKTAMDEAQAEYDRVEDKIEADGLYRDFHKLLVTAQLESQLGCKIVWKTPDTAKWSATDKYETTTTPSEWAIYKDLDLDKIELTQISTIDAHIKVVDTTKTNYNNARIALTSTLANDATHVGFVWDYLEYLQKASRMDITMYVTENGTKRTFTEDNYLLGSLTQVGEGYVLGDLTEGNNRAKVATMDFKVTENKTTDWSDPENLHSDDFRTVYETAQTTYNAFMNAVYTNYEQYQSGHAEKLEPREIDMAKEGNRLREMTSTLSEAAKTLSKWMSGDLYDAYLANVKSVDGMGAETWLETTGGLTRSLTNKTFHNEGIINEIVSVYAGSAYTAAITEEGYLYMWGTNGQDNDNGSILGNRETKGVSPKPGLVYKKDIGADYLSNLVRLGSNSGNQSSRHMLAHKDTGTTMAWGNNNKGQL